MKVATLNIWNRCGPWEDRRVAIRTQLQELSPDVIGLQEVLRGSEGNGFDQAHAIARGLGYEVAWGLASDHRGSALGNAVLSRWPIARTSVVPLPRGGTDEERSLLLAELDTPFGKVAFFVTHLNWKFHHGHVRTEQVRFVADTIMHAAPIGTFPPIVVGDFNAEPDSDEIRFMRGLTGLGGKCGDFADCFGGSGFGMA